MTNLSKELCEVCGIEPKLPCKRCGASKFALGQCAEVKCKAVYPDFENNNNNFVKLLEIVSKKASVSFCHNGTYYGCSIHYFFKDIFEAVEGTLQHNFLNTLLVQDLRNPCKPKLLEQLKQAIKETEWVYE